MPNLAGERGQENLSARSGDISGNGCDPKEKVNPGYLEKVLGCLLWPYVMMNTMIFTFGEKGKEKVEGILGESDPLEKGAAVRPTPKDVTVTL